MKCQTNPLIILLLALTYLFLHTQGFDVILTRSTNFNQALFTPIWIDYAACNSIDAFSCETVDECSRQKCFTVSPPAYDSVSLDIIAAKTNAVGDLWTVTRSGIKIGSAESSTKTAVFFRDRDNGEYAGTKTILGFTDLFFIEGGNYPLGNCVGPNSGGIAVTCSTFGSVVLAFPSNWNIDTHPQCVKMLYDFGDHAITDCWIDEETNSIWVLTGTVGNSGKTIHPESPRPNHSGGIHRLDLTTASVDRTTTTRSPIKSYNPNSRSMEDGLYYVNGWYPISHDYDPGRDVYYIGGLDAGLFVLRTSNNQINQVFNTVPSMAITSMVYFQPTDILILGTSTGIALEVTIQDFTINDLFYLDSFPIMTNMIIGSLPDVDFERQACLIISGRDKDTGEFHLWRVNYILNMDTGTSEYDVWFGALEGFAIDDNNFEEPAGTILPGVSNLYFLNVLSGDIVIYPSQTASNTIKSYTLTISDCDSYNTCTQCLTIDRLYCRHCYAQSVASPTITNTNGMPCTRISVCGPGRVIVKHPTQCPIITSSTPRLMPHKQQGSITLRGLLSHRPQTRLLCKFTDGSTHTATVEGLATPDQLECGIPAFFEELNGVEKDISVSLQVSSTVHWADAFTIKVYDCSTNNCNECSSKPGCGWCLSSSSCSASSDCPSDWINTCPSILSVDPPIAPYNEQTSLTVEVSHLASSVSYQCSFEIEGSTFLTTATYIDANHISCQTPTAENLKRGVASIHVQSSGNQYSLVYPYEFYDCVNYSFCTNCLTDRPRCKWCGDSCMFVTDTCTGHSDTSQCPSILSVTPDIVRNDYNGDFGLQVNGFGSESYQCVYTFPSSETETIPGSIVNSTYLTCGTPVHFEVGTVSLYIGVSGQQFSSSVSIVFYNCESSSCFECVDNGSKKCKWSHDQMQCQNEEFSAPGYHTYYSNIDQCPKILSVIEPQRLRQASSTSLRLSVSLGDLQSLDTSLFACRFNNTLRRDGFNLLSSNSIVSCKPPGYLPIGPVAVSINYGSQRFTPSVEMEVFSCPSVARKDCLSYGCTLCSSNGLSCVDNCSPADTLAPTLDKITPSEIYEFGGDTLVISGGPFPNPAPHVYICQFGSPSLTSSATWINRFTLQCLAPGGYSSNDSVELKIVHSDDPSAAIITTTLNIYQCSSVENDVSCDGTCFEGASRYCGWCFRTKRCTAQHICEYGSWASECPKVKNITQSYSRLEGGDDIVLTLSTPLQSVVSDYQASLSAFRAPNPITCEFGVIDTSEGVPSIVNGELLIACKSPSYNVGTSVTLAFKWDGYPLLTVPFEYADCITPTSCTSCISGNNVCGGCFEINRCGYPNDCLNSGRNFSRTCPVLRNLAPDSGNVNGGTKVYIHGSFFYEEMVELQVLFGDKNATGIEYINETTISVISPANEISSFGTPVTVQVNGRPYYTTSRTFTYIREVNVLAIVLGVLFGVVLPIAVVIIILAVLKRKKLGVFKLKLQEPNYLEVIFGKHLKPLFKMPKDRYKALHDALMDEDKSLILIVSSGIQPTEHDKISRSFAELFYINGKLKEYMIAFVNDEVQRQSEENTIFRGNTIASKMFQIFAKIVGTKFLWNKIARLMKELDTLGEERLKRESNRGLGDDEYAMEDVQDTSTYALQTTKKGGQSVFRMEMEVDPTRIIEDAIEQDAMDAQANAYQLILTCQKIWGTLVKSLREIPDDLREVFIVCKDSIKAKFSSDDAVYKTIGGFLFLRFICPAFTIPHAYGLLEHPPNPISQRQFVLIGKVLQNLANMVMPGVKEPYMAQLDEFFRKNIPRMQEFYIEILKPTFNPELSEKFSHPIKPDEVPKVVLENALAEIWSVMHRSRHIREYVNREYEDDQDKKNEIHAILDALDAQYPPPISTEKKKTPNKKRK